MRHGAAWGARVLVGVLILALVGIWVLTQTDWGRDRIRLFGLRQLAERVHGRVTIGEGVAVGVGCTGFRDGESSQAIPAATTIRPARAAAGTTPMTDVVTLMATPR